MTYQPPFAPVVRARAQEPEPAEEPPFHDEGAGPDPAAEEEAEEPAEVPF